MSFDAHAMRGLTLQGKQRVLVEALRRRGDCAWPCADGVEVIPLGGGRIALSVDAAVTRIAEHERSAGAPERVPQGDGALITVDANGQRVLRISDPVEASAMRSGLHSGSTQPTSGRVRMEGDPQCKERITQGEWSGAIRIIERALGLVAHPLRAHVAHLILSVPEMLSSPSIPGKLGSPVCGVR